MSSTDGTAMVSAARLREGSLQLLPAVGEHGSDSTSATAPAPSTTPAPRKMLPPVIRRLLSKASGLSTVGSYSSARGSSSSSSCAASSPAGDDGAVEDAAFSVAPSVVAAVDEGDAGFSVVTPADEGEVGTAASVPAPDASGPAAAASELGVAVVGPPSDASGPETGGSAGSVVPGLASGSVATGAGSEDTGETSPGAPAPSEACGASIARFVGVESPRPTGGIGITRARMTALRTTTGAARR